MYDLWMECFEKNGRGSEVMELCRESPHQSREFVPQSAQRFPNDGGELAPSINGPTRPF